MDSMNDEDDMIEDENRNPVSMQINQSSSVTRAGVNKGNFGPNMKLSPTKPKANLISANEIRDSFVQRALEIGTEETVLKNVDHKLI